MNVDDPLLRQLQRHIRDIAPRLVNVASGRIAAAGELLLDHAAIAHAEPRKDQLRQLFVGAAERQNDLLRRDLVEELGDRFRAQVDDVVEGKQETLDLLRLLGPKIVQSRKDFIHVIAAHAVDDVGDPGMDVDPAGIGALMQQLVMEDLLQ